MGADFDCTDIMRRPHRAGVVFFIDVTELFVFIVLCWRDDNLENTITDDHIANI